MVMRDRSIGAMVESIKSNSAGNNVWSASNEYVSGETVIKPCSSANSVNRPAPYASKNMCSLPPAPCKAMTTGNGSPFATAEGTYQRQGSGEPFTGSSAQKSPRYE